MHMAIELNNRTKVLAGVVLLAAVGYGAWIFFLEDFLNEPPPKAAAAKSAPAAAPKQADAAKPAAAAPMQTDAAKAAPAVKPGAKPIPANPDRLIAEVIETSGIKTQFQAFGREAVLQADMGGEGPGAAEERAIIEIFERVYEPGKMSDELTASLKNNLDVERMGRFLELLRQPIALKMTARETRNAPPEVVKDLLDKFRKNPPSPARVKLIQELDDVTRTSEVALEMLSTIARSMVDTMLTELQKKGKNVPKEARQTVASQLNAMRDQAGAQIRSVLYVTYRNATDEELAEYVKLLDTDTGRWGNEVLAIAVRPVLASRGSALGADAGKLAMSRRGGTVAKKPVAPEPVAKIEEQKPSEKPAAAPVEKPGYRRAANIREIYSRYNDVITATVMRDRAAVKELLDDGKNPNARQSDGMTPLMVAVSNGDADIAAMLLAKGADPNLRAGGRSALSIAKSRGSSGAGLVQLLERSGAKN
jgi:hypothetical protein